MWQTAQTAAKREKCARPFRSGRCWEAFCGGESVVDFTGMGGIGRGSSCGDSQNVSSFPKQSEDGLPTMELGLAMGG
jgi:hypothetical protein